MNTPETLNTQQTTTQSALDAILKRANDCHARGDSKMTREFLGLAIELAPDNSDLLAALGSIQYKEKDYMAALANFGKAAALNPKDPNLQIQLGMAHLELKHFKQAEVAFGGALELRPGDPLAAQLSSRVYDLQKKFCDEKLKKYLAGVDFSLEDAVGRGFATVGRWTYGFPRISWWGERVGLKIGSFCSLATGINIILGGEHNTKQISTFAFTLLEYCKVFNVGPEIDTFVHNRGDVVIGNDVWIGAGVTIMSGVKIGHGAVVGAGAVVTKDIPPYAIAVGVPAKPVRRRFSESQIAQLLEVKWWDLSDADIGKLCPLLFGEDVDRLVAAVRDLRDPGRCESGYRAEALAKSA